MKANLCLFILREKEHKLKYFCLFIAVDCKTMPSMEKNLRLLTQVACFVLQIFATATKVKIMLFFKIEWLLRALGTKALSSFNEFSFQINPEIVS